MVSNDESGGTAANMGITLPSKEGATHNIGLSPFFIPHNGFNNAETITMTARNTAGRLWSTVARNDRYGFYLGIDSNNGENRPSHNGTRTNGFPLRCLVSTANS